MSFAWAQRVAPFSLLLACACKGSTEAPATPASDAGADASSPMVITFSYDPNFACASGGLCAPPSQIVTLGIDTSTDATVGVALEGSYADAALTVDHVTTVGGHGLVMLETSSTQASFTIVARAGTSASAPSATLAVAVDASGFATLRVLPTYAGKRAAPGFFASALTGSTCHDVGSAAPGDAAWVPVSNDTTVLIPVPAETTFAVDARIGHYAMGCADVPPLAASVTRDVGIDVYDVPMALALSDMTTTFTFTPDAPATAAWQSAMGTAATNVGDAFFGAGSDGTALLDAMRTQVAPADQAAFDTARTSGGWDASANTWLSSHAPTIHLRAAAWLNAAASDGVGALVMHLASAANVGFATMTPATLGALTSTQAGLTAPTPFDWTADADDTVHLAGTVTLASSPYIAHLADTHAAAQVPNATSDVPGAIASQIDCQGLAANLIGSGDAYGTCGASCFAYVCVNALAAAWTSALASPANGSDALNVQLTVGAPTEVGDEAEPQYFQGGWLGQVAGPIVSTSFSIKGNVVGAETSAPTQ